LPKSRKLKNIEVKEVSLVDDPATRRDFMFWKSADGPPDSPLTDLEKKFTSLRIAFESDGSGEGTALTINGSRISELSSFTLSAAPMGGGSMNLYCNYTQGARGERSDGFKPTYTYTLAKALGVVAEMEKVIRHEGDKWVLYTSDGKKKLGMFDTEEEALAQERAIHARQASKRLEPGDLENVQAYLNDLPPQLRKSVENMVGAVQEMGEPIEKEEEQTVPDPTNQDGKKMEAPVAAAAQVDLSGVMDALGKITGAVGTLTEKVGAMEAADKAAKDAAAATAAEAAGHDAAVTAGDEVKFESEDDALAAIAAEASQEAVDEAEAA